MIFGLILAAVGIAIILFSGLNGGLNVGNLIVGFLIAVVGGLVGVSERKDNVAENASKEFTHSSKEKTTSGNHITVEEEVTTKRVTNETTGGM
ncbi:MAG: hypothetical protein WCW13_04130 [archaeon]